MTFQQIIKHFGTLTQAAKALECKLSTVSDWRYGVPFGMQCWVEIVTEGKLRANRAALNGRYSKKKASA